jgi:hypothetical protein
MQLSHPNKHGSPAAGHEEIVARHGRAYAAVTVALADDGLYYRGVDPRYSYGGYGSAPSIDEPGFPNLPAAVTAGLEELLRRWHKPFPSEPQSVHDKLNDLRHQIDARLRQPTLLCGDDND